MRKVRKRRIESVREQIARHIGKIKDEPGRLDTTKDYWKKEIDEKFLKQLEEDESYLKENNGNTDKKSS